MSAQSNAKSSRKFVTSKNFASFATQPAIKAAQDLLRQEDLSEEGFLGAQAVLLINGLI